MDSRQTDQAEKLRAALAGIVAEDLPQVLADARHEARRRATAVLAEAMSQALIDGAAHVPPAAAPDASPVSEPETRSAVSHIPAGEPEAPAARSDTEASEPEAPTAVQATPASERETPAALPDHPASAPDTDDALGLYLYCVTRADTTLPALTGIDPAHTPTMIDDGELAAVVSQVPLADFEEDRLREHLNDMGWLERTARSHEAVLDAVGEHETLIPMRLCTIYRGESGVREMLLREQGALKHALAHLEGKSEWGVKVFATDGTAAPATEPSIGEADRQPGEDRTAGTAYLRDRQAERDRREHRYEELYAVCSAIHERLAAVAADAITTSPQRPEVSGHAGEMLLNGVYLVEAGELSRFLAEVDQVRAEHKALGLEVEPTGPWPAYNFVPGTIGAAW